VEESSSEDDMQVLEVPGLMQEKLKGKGKAKVVDKAVEEAWKEKVAKLKVEIAVNLELIA
jgi:hypothetical protein